MEDTVMTFTGNELESIKTRGGDYDWSLNQNRAGNCKYLVCCHSQGAKKGTAFLVGLISKIENSDERPERAKICISEYAEINIPDVWGGWQNPIKYTSLEELGINISDLNFEQLENKEN